MSELRPEDTLRHDIDLLVDGELAEERRRRLLRTLDDVVGGWRQLALSYVESQTMREAFAGARQSESKQSAETVQPAVVSHPVANHSGASPLTFFAAVAASFLVALAIGLSIRSDRQPVANNPPADPQPVAKTPDSTPAPSKEQPRTVFAKHDAAANHMGEATLIVRDADGVQRRVQFPVIFSQEEEAAAQLLSEPIVPQHIVEAMRRLGHRVEQHRNIVPVALEDGRQMFVPVDEVNVQYVGLPGYQ